MVRTSTSGSSVSPGLRIALGLTAFLVLSSAITAVFGQGAGEDRGKVVGDKVCSLCHGDVKESFAESIHGGLSTGEGSSTCETCHGPGERHAATMGEKQYIVRFGELSPEQSSKRCLACHRMTASPGSHIDGFLESRMLQSGMGCADCHSAHAPKSEMAPPPPAPKKPKTVGSDSCLVCHSDRPELKKFSHLERLKDMGGCEVCHGPGREHAEARGRGPIRVSEKLEPAKANAGCMLCHSDYGPPEHFQPSAGKERCTDCHVIHEPPPPPAAEPEPGRPPFRLDRVEAAPPPAPLRRAFLRRPAPPLPEERTEIGGLLVSGEIRAGFRYAGVDGNEKVFDQDVNLDTGPRLFDFRLDATPAAAPENRLSLSASGIDDPVETYSLLAEHGELIRLSAKATRTNFVYHATGDPFDQAARKETAGIDLTVAPEGEFRFRAGLDLWRRDATRLGQRFVNRQPTAVEEPIDEDSIHGWIAVDWSHGPLAATVMQGYRSETLDSDIRTTGSAVPPFGKTLDYERKTDVTAPVTTILASFRPSRAWTVDGKLVWSPMDTETDVFSRETGPAGGAGFVEDVFGDVDGERNYLRGEIGATWYAGTDLSVSARWEGMLSDEENDSSWIVRRQEPAFSAPVTTTSATSFDREHTLSRFELSALYRFSDAVAVRAGFEYGFQQIVREETGMTEDVKNFDFYGPVLGLDLDPTKDLSVEAEYRFTKNDDPFVTMGEEERSHVKLRARWQAAPDLGLTAFLNGRTFTNGIHDTQVSSWSGGMGATLEFSPDLVLDLGWSVASYDTETDVLRYFAGMPVAGVSEFDGTTLDLHAYATWAASIDLDITGGLRWSHSSGDYEIDVIDLSVGAVYRLRHDLALGLDLRYLDYDEDGASVDDYDAFLTELWLRFRF